MSQLGQKRKCPRLHGTSVLPSRADIVRSPWHVCLVPIVLQKSNIERRRKFRESRFFDASDAATRCSAVTKVCCRFCVNQCGPSRPHAQNASAVLRNFRRQPKKTFATLSATSGRWQRRLWSKNAVGLHLQ